MAADDDDVPKAKKAGEYEVLVGTTAVAFWPLSPGTTPADAMPPLVCSPNTPASFNAAFIPVFGIVEVVIRQTDEVNDEDVEPQLLANTVMGPAKLKKAALIREDSGDIRICFAVDQSAVATGGAWEGTLRLTAPQKVGTSKQNRKMEVKLKVDKLARVDGLFIFFVVHKTPKVQFAWMQLHAVDAADGSTAIAGAAVQLKVLRDNFDSGYRGINRRVDLVTNDDGDLAYADCTTLAMPVEWPLILNATAGGFVPRGHMVRIPQAEGKKDQTKPFVPGAKIRMTASGAAASLAGKKIVLDPGHGVVYALKAQRRSQEWFVAHKVADLVCSILVSEHGIDRDSILFTKTAGLGLIEPANVHAGGAPETGVARFEIDLPGRRIRARLNTVRLDELCALLITPHQGDNDQATPLTEDQWNGWLAANTNAIDVIVAAINAQLAPQSRRVLAGSLRWNVATKRFVYTREILNPKPGAPTQMADPVNLPLATTDWFPVDDAAFEILADRTARWSIQCEIGGDGTFPAHARAAMKAAGAREYMSERILESVRVPAPHPFVEAASPANKYPEMGWSPARRNRYFNNQGADADLIVTLHENAKPANATLSLGGAIMITHHAGADGPPDDEVRVAKIFVKHLDPFDQGVRQGGIAKTGGDVGLLNGGNQRRAVYAYFESEFMDEHDPDDPAKYRYEAMTSAGFITALARQIVNGAVEYLLDPQADLDSVTYNAGSKFNGLW